MNPVMTANLASGAAVGNLGVLDLIGDTPNVDVSHLSPNPDVRLIAKLEMQNPFGSVKDRIAKAMIEICARESSFGDILTIQHSWRTLWVVAQRVFQARRPPSNVSSEPQ